MQAGARAVPLSLAPILPPTLRKWSEPLDPVLCRLLIPGRLVESLNQARRVPGNFAPRLLELLEIRYLVSEADRARIPARGAALIVANHPYGFVEGLILLSLARTVRWDVRVMANSLLAGFDEIRDDLILVNPFEPGIALHENCAPVRQSLSWLESGGLLTIFPAGEVAHLDLRKPGVVDSPWKATAARLAMRAGAPVLPVFFEGANGLGFHLAGAIHPTLRTIRLPRELEQLRGRTLRLQIGSRVEAEVLRALGGAAKATAYLRSRTYFLSSRAETVYRRRTTPAGSYGAVADGRRETAIPEEIAALRPDCELPGNSEFALYVAEAGQIPTLLEEIGRSRELAFRKVGEGTGHDLDLDRFDDYYKHLILWHRRDRRLAGAYRLAATSDILPRYGVQGLYTNSLFHFHAEFFRRLGPAVELGRSFIHPDYQKSYAPLLLLWKGISRYVLRQPEAAVLFGAVSISDRYSRLSRSLLATWLSQKARHELARYVRPRNRFRNPVERRGEVANFVALLSDLEDLAAPIADVEPDGKSVPVLVRQYLKAGGRLLGFNVDPKFSNTLDALIVVELKHAPPALIERIMGKAEGAQFFAASGRLPPKLA